MQTQTKPLHERFLAAIAAERTRSASRRGFVAGGAKLAGAGAVALAGGAGLVRSASAQDATPEAAPAEFASDVDILNYALTLEHLEYAFYRDGLNQFGLQGFTDAEQAETVYPALQEVRTHEAQHVQALIDTITELGGTPVEEQEYDFGYEDVAGFLATAAALEETGVAAYAGAAPQIEDAAVLSAALGIHSVEARHSAYLNTLIESSAFPNAFDAPLTTEEVLAAVEPFIVAPGADGATPEAEATPDA